LVMLMLVFLRSGLVIEFCGCMNVVHNGW
jgi:hypothetical protein